MFDHLGITTRDLSASVRFYDAVLTPLGHKLTSQDATCAGFGSPSATPLWLYAGGKTQQSTHIAFAATNRKSVDQFYAAGLRHGGKDNGPPAVRADYSSNYYAAFLLDPDGNNVEAVCLQTPSA